MQSQPHVRTLGSCSSLPDYLQAFMTLKSESKSHETIPDWTVPFIIINLNLAAQWKYWPICQGEKKALAHYNESVMGACGTPVKDTSFNLRWQALIDHLMSDWIHRSCPNFLQHSRRRWWSAPGQQQRPYLSLADRWTGWDCHQSLRTVCRRGKRLSGKPR